MQVKSVILGIFVALFIGTVLIFTLNFFSSQSSSGKVSPFVSEVESVEEVTNSNPKSITEEDLINKLQEYPGTYGLYINDLESKTEISYNEKTTFHGASLYKILVAGAVYDLVNEDKLSMNYVYTYEPADYSDGTGVLQNYKPGSSYPVDELLDYLLKNSDNVAQNILMRNISWEEVNNFYLKYSPLEGTFATNMYTTPEEVGLILENIYKNTSWGKSLKRDFFDRMVETQFEDRISLGISPGLTFSHKIGIAPLYASWHDCGILFGEDFSHPKVVCLMSKNTNFDQFKDFSFTLGQFLSTW